MKYYAIVQAKITDDSWLADYLPNVTKLVHKHGGNYLARTQTMEKIEGAGGPPDVCVLLEWPSKEAFKAFYGDPEYQPYLKSRQAGSTGEFLLFAGEDIAGA